MNGLILNFWRSGGDEVAGYKNLPLVAGTGGRFCKMMLSLVLETSFRVVVVSSVVVSS